MIKTLSKIGLIVGAVLIVSLLALAFCANILTVHDPISANVEMNLSAPSQQYPFGADNLGRDVQSRVFYGWQISLGVSALSVLAALVVGTIFGVIGALLEEIAGSVGKAVNNSVILFARFLSSGPGILLLILIPVAYGTGGILSTAVGIAIVLLPGFIRVFGGLISSLKDNDTLGVLGMVVAQISLNMALAVVVLAGLSFFGLGIQPPWPEFGNMISAGIQYIRMAPHIIIYPGLALAVTALSFNIFGESLNTFLVQRRVSKAPNNNSTLATDKPEGNLEPANEH